VKSVSCCWLGRSGTGATRDLGGREGVVAGVDFVGVVVPLPFTATDDLRVFAKLGSLEPEICLLWLAIASDGGDVEVRMPSTISGVAAMRLEMTFGPAALC
jgi:hypothetical protein